MPEFEEISPLKRNQTNPETSLETSGPSGPRKSSQTRIKLGELELAVETVPPPIPDPRSVGDLWTKAVDAEVVSGTSTAVETPSPISPGEGGKFLPSGKLSVEVGTAVLEIQTALRSDLERLRLDVVRQFVLFKDEMGKKWKDEVEYLRDENVALKTKVETLQREAKNRNVGGW